MSQTCPNRSETSYLMIRNTFSTSISHIRVSLKKVADPPPKKKFPRVVKQFRNLSIRVQNPWFFFPVKVENSNFSKIRIFWWEISTAYRNFRLSEKISFKNFKFDVNHCAVQKASNLVGWSYKTRFSLLDVQTFVEKKNNWDRSRICDYQQKTFEQ